MALRILLYSGGIDSLIAWYYLEKPQRLYVQLGTRYSQDEAWSMWHYGPEPESIRYRDHLSWGAYEKEGAWLPMRNMLLVMLAAAEGADTIYLVAQKGEQNIPDRSLEFFGFMSQQMTIHNERNITVFPVFPNMDKVAMVKWYLDKAYPIQQLLHAFSCYTPVAAGSTHCGECAACWRKFIALEANGIDTAQLFHEDIRAWGEVHYRPRLNEYIPERVAAMTKVMGWE